MTTFGQVFGGAAAIVAGILLVVGATKGWRWLMDPSESLSYSHYLIKKIAGADVLKTITIYGGLFLIAFGVAMVAIAMWPLST